MYFRLFQRHSISDSAISKIITLSVNDLKHVLRDKMLIIFLFSPVLLLLFVRLVIPFITEKFPYLSEYHLYIMMFAAMQTSIMLGFISSFIILEEKDEKVLEVIRILPIQASFFLACRLLFSAVFSFIGSLIIIQFNGLIFISFSQALLLASQFSLVAPLITLVISTYAANKIEGLAFFKGIDLLLLLPMAAFFVPDYFKYLFGLFPVFWSFRLYEACLEGENIFMTFSIGLIVYILYILFFANRFIKLVFNR